MTEPTRWFAAGLLALAGYTLSSSAPRGWAGADAPDGTRFKISLVGISHVLEPRTTVSPTRDCRWRPPSGDAELCRVRTGGETAWRRLRLLEPALWIAIGMCVIAAVMSAAGVGPRGARIGVILLAAGIPAGLMLAITPTVEAALAALEGVEVGLAATLATMQAMLTMLLALLAAGLQRPGWRLDARSALGTLTSLVAPFAGLRFGGWPGVAGGFALAAVLLLAPRRAQAAGSA